MATRPDLARAGSIAFYTPQGCRPRRTGAPTARGEIRPGTDLELVTDLLAGPIYTYALGVAGPVPSGYAEQLVDAVLDALR